MRVGLRIIWPMKSLLIFTRPQWTFCTKVLVGTESDLCVCCISTRLLCREVN